ncbi:hypothetical protein D3C72_1964320 [compost metagenome]
MAKGQCAPSAVIASMKTSRSFPSTGAPFGARIAQPSFPPFGEPTSITPMAISARP